MNNISTEVKNKLVAHIESILIAKQKLTDIYNGTKQKLEEFNNIRSDSGFYNTTSYDYCYHENIFIKTLNKDCWRRLLDNREIRIILPKERFDKLIVQEEYPEFNANIVISTIEQLYQDKDKYMLENIIYCFKQLDNNYKTNSSYVFRDKSIINVAYYRYHAYGTLYYSYSSYSNALMSLENLFCNLDNIQIPQDESITIIENYEKCVGKKFDLKYFKIKAYKNGNVHIEYKDKEKLKMLNKILHIHFGQTLANDK